MDRDERIEFLKKVVERHQVSLAELQSITSTVFPTLPRLRSAGVSDILERMRFRQTIQRRLRKNFTVEQWTALASDDDFQIILAAATNLQDLSAVSIAGHQILRQRHGIEGRSGGNSLFVQKGS